MRCGTFIIHIYSCYCITLALVEDREQLASVQVVVQVVHAGVRLLDVVGVLESLEHEMEDRVPDKRGQEPGDNVADLVGENSEQHRESRDGDEGRHVHDHEVFNELRVSVIELAGGRKV